MRWIFLSTLSLRRATNGWQKASSKVLFLSTLSLRRATFHLFASSGVDFADFYPRSPCGERLPINVMSVSAVRISIHALLAESDKSIETLRTVSVNFYPRSPCGERLWPGLLARPFFIISIHALLAESDTTSEPEASNRTISIHALLAESDDNGRIRDAVNLTISIHALLAESDPQGCFLVILII